MALGPGIKARVLERNGDLRRQRSGQPFVGFGEIIGVQFIEQVQPAADARPGQNRRAQERVWQFQSRIVRRPAIVRFDQAQRTPFGHHSIQSTLHWRWNFIRTGCLFV